MRDESNDSNFKNLPNDLRPPVYHLRTYGYHAYAMTAEAKDGEQGPYDSKAVISYLAGYVSSKIYMVWIPWKKEVIETADVIFNEDIIYRDDDIGTAVREEIVVLADTPPLPEEDDLYEFDAE